MKRVSFGLSLALVMFLAGCGGESWVAKIDGRIIAKEELEIAMERSRQQFKLENLPQSGTDEYTETERRMLQRLVNEEVYRLEADKLGISVSNEEVMAQMEWQKEMSGDEDLFLQRLNTMGFTLDQFTENISNALLFKKIYFEVTKDVPPVTDDEALQFYKENEDEFRKPEIRKIRHIPVADEVIAKQIKARLDAGDDFAALAKEFSVDPFTKDKGGDLGEINTQKCKSQPLP